MNRESVKKNIDIISAFAEGKVIQISNEIGEWVDLTEREGLPMGTLEETPDIFRVKPEPKYRPFANAEECWQEMLRHEPFGWVKSKQTQNKFACKIVGKCIVIGIENDAYTYDETFGNYTFTDGLPFGIKVEE